MIRKASIADAKRIQNLIHLWADKGKMLDRSLNYVYENIRDFWVCEEKRRIIGCCALHVVGWESLSEIKSLAVDPKHHGKGIAVSLVSSCLEEAKRLGLENVFALTFVASFFKKIGFKKISRSKLPHKI